MTKLGQMLVDDGYKRGKIQGALLCEKRLSHRLIFIYYLEKISHGKILEETELQRILR